MFSSLACPIVLFCVLFWGVGAVQFSRSFWEMRGFQEETYFDVLALFNRVDEFTACKVVLRAGERYVEYQPASGNQLSQ